ncbi:cysteine--tRNA ligase [Candidatus Woesearchaeota archaeon B3_Woes]|nr:MAG: cysteine--tRNA ligase [Candidatus Woesearchaeota archaeon B3_Woes]
MALKLYNTLTRKKELFKPIKKGHVGMYSCGPTVYWYQHIGNLRTYIFNDILKRVLNYNNFKTKHVMNYTDVGHLTSDADTGEDKIEKAAKKEGKTAKQISEYYASVFEKDCKKLNIIPPNIICKATDHIKEQIALVKLLEKKGFTYQTSDGVYFNTSKLKDYGKLGLIDLEGLEAGKRVSLGEKRNKTDFALWKFSDTLKKRQQEWKTKWGIGFPGWHLECSAMSSKYLGKQFDIHTGGEDHIQVHHTNEIAQSEAAFNVKPWVKYWLHGAFLTHKSEKISKSTGGLYTISDLEKNGFTALAYRYFCLNTSYRKQLNFSLEILEGAKNSYERLKNIIIDLKSKKDSNKTKEFEKYRKQFKEYIDDDLNMPKALSVLWDVLRDEKLGSKEKLELAYDFDKVFGLDIKDIEEEKQKLDKEIKELIEQREKARKNKDYSKADKIRDDLKKKGIVLEDTSEGVRWKKV